jgi:hypothetical protein
MKKERTIATILGISILFAILIFAVFFVMRSFQAYADDLGNYESSASNSSVIQSTDGSGTCTSCGI